MTQANNSVLVTPGVGETIATQAAGGKEYQVVVIADQNGDMDPNPVRTTKSYIPASADILSGSVTVSNSTTATTIITIPAGRTWYGSVGLEVSDTGGANSAFEFAWVMTTGTGVAPAAGTKIIQCIGHKAGTASVNFDASTPSTYVAAPVGNSVTLQVQLDSSNATYGAVAYCNGVLL